MLQATILKLEPIVLFSAIKDANYSITAHYLCGAVNYSRATAFSSGSAANYYQVVANYSSVVVNCSRDAANWSDAGPNYSRAEDNYSGDAAYYPGTMVQSLVLV